jgi:hypothetical protein
MKRLTGSRPNDDRFAAPSCCHPHPCRSLFPPCEQLLMAAVGGAVVVVMAVVIIVGVVSLQVKTCKQ